MTPVSLACPADRAPLSGSEGAAHWSCPQCGNDYPVERGVVRFLEETDRFYEGRYLKTVRFLPRTESWLWAWPLWLINSGYVWAARKYIPAEATALEMGCASGFAYFAHRYRVIGLDLSFTSLAQVAPLYETCLQADAVRAIPLPDASVDAVLSSFVWEHILPGDKPAVLAECRRVLRPGGHLVFLYDVESRNPLYRLMKRRDENLYREIFIDREGHLGWQTPAENRAAFESAGFRVVEQRGHEKILISPFMYDKVRHWGGGLRTLAAVGDRLRKKPWSQLYNGFVRVFDETAGRALPESWSRVLVTVCQKQ